MWNIIIKRTKKVEVSSPFHSLSLLVCFFLIGHVSTIKIKEEKVTTTNSPPPNNSYSSIMPKFTPSQQIVTELLTPPQHEFVTIRNKGGRTNKGGGKKKKGKNVKSESGGDMSGGTGSGWKLEFPRVPVGGGGESVIINNMSGSGHTFPTVNPTTNSSDLRNSFTFSNLADSSWVGIGESSSSSSSSSLIHNNGIVVSNNVNNNNQNVRDQQLVMASPEQPYDRSSSSMSSVNRIGIYVPDDDDEDNSSQESKENKKSKRSKKIKSKKKNISTEDDKNRDNVNEEDDGPAGKIVDVKIQKLEELMTSLSKNVDVMRQNTQVISKGFNILSTRFNKLTSDQDELGLKLDKKFVLVEEGIIRMQKEIGKKLKDIEAKGETHVKSLKKADHDLLQTQAANGQEHKKWMETLSGKVVGFKSDFEKESKVLAEMVKALAEIQKKEKAKLDQFGKKFENEMAKLATKLDTQKEREDLSFQERLGQDNLLNPNLINRVEQLELKLQSTQGTVKNESDLLKRELGDLSKYIEDKWKRLDESLQDQNMAHNLAHEHIAGKVEALSSYTSATKFARGDVQKVEDSIMEDTSPIYPLVLDRLTKLERNLSEVEKSGRKIREKVESMEDTDLSILSRIADLRNSQTVQVNWTKGEISKLQEKLNDTEWKVRDLGESRLGKLSKFRKEQSEQQSSLVIKNLDDDDNVLMEVGGLSMNGVDPTFEPPPPRTEQSLIRTTGFYTTVAADINNDDLSDRVASVEENVAELWRSQKECKAEGIHVQNLIRDLQDNQQKLQEGAENAAKHLSDLVRNSTYKIIAVQNQVIDLEERLKGDRQGHDEDQEDEEVSARVKGSSSPLNPEDVNLLREEIQSVRNIVEDLLTSNKNVTKAQEFFLLKLLEMDQEHKKDNQTLGGDLYSLRNETEDTFLEITRSEDRLNKVVQQFEITDAEQVKIREELWNIKDRLNGLEENYVSLWKTNKKFISELEQVVNSVDNINLVHGNELQTLSTDLGQSKEKLENVTKIWRNVDNRLSNVELLMDMEVTHEPNTSELGKLKQRLSSTEKDISELWKSSEILSFQQQVMAENFKFLEATHDNDTAIASLERGRTQQDALHLISLYKNVTKRLTSVEKCTNPQYVTKTINFLIPDWSATSTSEGGLRDQFLEYEVGSLLNLGSNWKTYLDLNGTQLTLFNMLMRSEVPMWNEFEIQILDGEGRIFTTVGPEQHLYNKKGDSICISNVVSLHTLENPKFGLLSRNTLRLKVKVRVYPKLERAGAYSELEDSLASQPTPSEKQLVLWEVKGLLRKLEDVQNSEELNITKEFVAGHTWSGFSLWRAGLLTKTINRQVYLGLNVEVVQRDGDWKELEASYNVTMLDAHSRIAKEFSISPNDFISVSARHSYFILVEDIAEILKRGDSLTFKIYFDLQAKRKSYDVEVIR